MAALPHHAAESTGVYDQDHHDAAEYGQISSPSHESAALYDPNDAGRDREELREANTANSLQLIAELEHEVLHHAERADVLEQQV